MDMRVLRSNKSEYERWSEELNRENRRAIVLLRYALLPLSVISMAAQSVVAAPEVTLFRSALLLLCALLFALIERFVIPKETRHATAWMYALSTPVFLLSALLETVWSPEREAVTILLLLVVLPMFTMDHFRRMATVMTLWLAIFIWLSCRSKPETLFYMDALHGAEFYFAALVIYLLALKVRMKYMRNLETAAYERDHDRKTGCLNRNALLARLGGNAGKPLTLLLADLEQLQLYRDYFGSAAADEMLRFFVETFCGVFGDGAVFSCAESELVCLDEGDAAACLEKLARCRDRLHTFRWEGRACMLSCAVGCVTAAPESEEDVQKLLRLANIYAHKARRTGSDRTVDGVFDEQALADGIHQSALLGENSGLDNNRLTGLPDLSSFVAHADVLLNNVVDRSRGTLVGYVKLQHLRDYNSRFGYTQGDALLVKTAERLRAAFPDRYLCHITGGQFCVLCYENEAEPGLAHLRAGQSGAASDASVSCKAGFAAFTGTESAISLIDRAMRAYESVRDGKDTFYRVYDRQLDEELRFQEYIVTHVDEAIASGWVRVYYQPIIRSITGEVCNEEALCRWQDPVYGLLSPSRFLTVLEARGLIYKIDLFVVGQVLREFAMRREQGVPIVPVSVNLSRRDFEECDMVAEIDALMEAARCDKRLIKIEITESAFVEDQERLKEEMRRFRAHGYDIWMDDFGSEYSTLILLQELDFDLLKIDMKFMENITPDGRNYVIVSKIIDMARELGVSALIEGVETKEQLRMMQVLGCEKIQGFLFNSPRPLSYIARRARTGTGLAFEKPDAAAYYEMVGRVNLNEPMANAEGKSRLLTADILPAGGVAARDGELYCLRGTGAFLRRLERWGMLSAEEDDTRIRKLAPLPQWSDLTARCMETENWVSFSDRTAKGRQLVVYARRLCGARGRGGVPFLVVLLPEVKL